jgi:hypothetical protein
MTRALDYPPQLLRLSRLLGVSADRLAPLQDVPEGQLRVLHDQIGEVLFAANRDSFARVAAMSRVLPGPLAGKLAERFLAPSLAARAAEMLEPHRAKDLVNHVSVPYLADISIALDPARAAPVVAHIAAQRVAEVAAELFRRDELPAMAEFAGAVGKDALAAAFGVATHSQLLRVAPFLVWNDDIDAVIDEIDDSELDEILRTAGDEDLWREASVLIHHLTPATLKRVAGRLARAPEVAARIPVALIRDLTTELFELDALDPMTAFAPALSDDQLREILIAAEAADQWPAITRLAADLEPETFARVSAILVGTPGLARRSLTVAI